MRHTHGSMTDLLRQRYSGQAGNGREWAFCADVRSAAGFDARRTMDALAMALWPSRGLALHGHEIKCHRSDWLRELALPEKADVWHDKVDYWWIVAADSTVVQAGELPPGWGLMVPNSKGVLQVQVQAGLIVPEGGAPAGKHRPVGRSFLAALLRSMQREGDIPPEEVRTAVAAAVAAEQARHDRESERQRTELASLRRMRREFEAASGVRMDAVGDQPWLSDRYPPDVVGAALRLVLAGESQVHQLQAQLARIAEQAERVAERARAAAAAEQPAVPGL